MDILLVDNSNDGHHKIYQDTLNNIENTKILNNIMKFEDVSNNFYKAYIQRKNFLKKVDEEIKEKSIVHFLYLDSIYKCPFISKFLYENKNVYIATLHWIPQDFIRKVMLKKFAKKLKLIIVHSEYLKEKLNDIGIKNVICIDYPSFIEKSSCLVEKNKNTEKINLVCLGGTRIDKGLDILCESFKYIDDISKDKLLFTIAGLEQSIKYEFIKKEAKKNNINIVVKNKFLTESEYVEEIRNASVILLPYRKVFSGNSGPMTDGVYLEKYILGPNYGNLGFLINKYNLGDTFNIEDPVDLGKKISEITEKNLVVKTEYSKKLDKDIFIFKHKEIYKELFQMI